MSFRGCTLPETNSSPLKMGLPNRKVVFQPSIFGCYVSLREGKCSVVDKEDYLSAIKAIFGGVNL